MRRNGREIDPEFASDEKLFRRCPADRQGEQIKAGEVHIDRIPFYPDMSVNRSKYSEPKDVLYPDFFQTFGVFSFRVEQIPDAISDDTGNHFEWKPIHVPEENNYGHSELRTFKNGEFDRRLEIRNKRIKKLFREILSDVAIIEIYPGDASSD